MSSSSVAERRIHSFWLGYKGYSDKVYALAISVLAAIWGLHIPDVPDEYGALWWLTDVGFAPNALLVGIFIVFILWCHSVFFVQRPRYSELVREKDRASRSSSEKAEAIESALRSVMRQLAIYCKANTDAHRVTAYVRHEGEFVAVARYSHNPKHCEISADGSKHQDGLGAIGQAWNGSESFRANLPADRVEWEERMCSAFGYTPERAAKFKMQSLSYAAIRIGNGDSSVGVLVVESTTALGVTRKTITSLRDSLVQAALAEMISEHSRHTPQIERLTQPASNKKPDGVQPARKWKKNSPAQTKSDVTARL